QPAEEYEYIVLKNISSNTTLNLAGVCFTNGIAFSFTGSATASLSPGASLYLARNEIVFRERYGNDRPMAGPYIGALDNGGERIRLVDLSNEEVLDFHYKSDWYPETDGHGASLIIVNENAEPDTWSSKTNWTSSIANSSDDSDRDGMPDVWEIAHG